MGKRIILEKLKHGEIWIDSDDLDKVHPKIHPTKRGFEVIEEQIAAGMKWKDYESIIKPYLEVAKDKKALNDVL
jgi:hypothetical protein